MWGGWAAHLPRSPALRVQPHEDDWLQTALEGSMVTLIPDGQEIGNVTVSRGGHDWRSEQDARGGQLAELDSGVGLRVSRQGPGVLALPSCDC